MTILETILADTRSAIHSRRQVQPEEFLERQVERAPLPADFTHALTSQAPGRTAIIAEIKRRSPSRGLLADRCDPAALALQYAAGGAAAVSVLTEERHFGGSLDDLSAVVRAVAEAQVSLPALRKDFMVSRYQLLESRLAGAAAVLLIAAMLTSSTLRELRLQAEGLGLAALVEVHDRAELDTALRAGARLVGINNRNLHTFKVDLGTSFALLPHVPPGIAVVSESGIKTAEDVRRLGEAGAAAVLVGETLMTSPDPAGMVADLGGRR